MRNRFASLTLFLAATAVAAAPLAPSVAADTYPRQPGVDAPGDGFGQSVAAFGDTVIVGAPLESTALAVGAVTIGACTPRLATDRFSIHARITR